MERVVIKRYGNGKEKVLEGLKQVRDIEIYGFTDKDTKLWGTCEKGYLVYSIFQVAELYKAKKIDKLVFACDIEMELLDRMVKEACSLGIEKEDIWITKPEFYVDSLKKHICIYEEYMRLPYIEFHVADHCNLNCKGCVHFSPLVKGKKFADFDMVKRDLLQLKKLVCYIDKIHILGGEPFLNEELDKYIDLVRDVYPFSEISVVTNGLLVMKMNERTEKAFKRNRATIAISSYLPVLGKIDEIIAYVKEKGIDVRCSETIYEFAYTFDCQGGHAGGAQKIHCTCPNLYEGHLAVCPPIAYLKYYNEYFGQKLDEQDGLIDIYDDDLTYDKLIEELHKVRCICDKCLFISKEDAVPMKWEQSMQRSISDYVWMGKS